MSMYRSIARMAAVSAINNFYSEPWPTLAGGNIFDSKIEPVEDMQRDRVFPCCVIYTDYDKDHWSKGQGVHRDRFLNITIELLVIMATKLDGAGELESYTVECPVTDSEIELSLDYLEAQVFRALSNGNEASDAFNFLCPSYENVISRRGASVEGGNRLAARQITLEMKAPHENQSGIIPPVLETFLARLEESGDYAERVSEIREFMRLGAAEDEATRLMRTFGWSRAVGESLGKPLNSVTMSTPITYNFSGLNG